MSQLVGLLSRRGNDVTQRLLKILRETHTRHDAYGIATPDAAEHSPKSLEFTSLVSSVALAHRLVRVLPTDNMQPLHDEGMAIALIGRIWDTEPSSLTLANILRNGTEEGLKELLMEHEGPWVTVVAEDEEIVCARDTIGTVPLYYGMSEEVVGISTDTRTLLRLGVEPFRVKPGHIVTLKKDGIYDQEIAPLEEPSQTSMSMEVTTEELDKFLIRATSWMSRDLNSPTLAFSGGLDSAILAYYLQRVGAHPRLTCVGSVDSSDIEAAEEAADALGLSVSIKTLKEAELEDHLDEILSSVEEANPMKVGVAAPLYFVALDASARPCRAVFSGNGSDELFGGYAKYTREYQIHGEIVRASMFQDVAHSYEVNLERDWKVCSRLGLELRTPFTEAGLTRFALSLPLRYKLPSEGKEPKKIILRHLAKRLGLRADIAEKPKKAAQYSSGMGKMIEKLAKRRSKSVEGYLSDRLEELRRNEQG